MEENTIQFRRALLRQCKTGVDVPVTDWLAAMPAPAVYELQHGQSNPSYGECVSGNLLARVIGDGQPDAVSHDGLLTPAGMPTGPQRTA